VGCEQEKKIGLAQYKMNKRCEERKNGPRLIERKKIRGENINLD